MIVRCRICFDEENINESQQEEELRKNNFVSPCNCAGSNKYVHAKCLDQWRKQNVNNFMKCPTCAGIYNIFQHFEYDIDPPPNFGFFCFPIYFPLEQYSNLMDGKYISIDSIRSL